jgi:hypothetical protein
MGLANVNGQEIGVVFVIVIELNDVANLATKWRSSEAAKNEDERATGRFFTDMEIRGAVESDEAGVGRLIADLERAHVHVRQGVAHHVEGVFRSTGHEAEEGVSNKKKNKEAEQSPFEKQRQGIPLIGVLRQRAVYHEVLYSAPSLSR